jgi:hypothetical protein
MKELMLVGTAANRPNAAGRTANLFAGFGAHIGDNDNMFFTNRFNNSVRGTCRRLSRAGVSARRS